MSKLFVAIILIGVILNLASWAGIVSSTLGWIGAGVTLIGSLCLGVFKKAKSTPPEINPAHRSSDS